MGRGLFVVIVLLSMGCARHSGRAPDSETPARSPVEIEQLETQIYTPSDWPQPLEATVYRPRLDGPLPAVMVVHGGGWARRSPADMTRVCEFLAGQGFVVINVAYRLAPRFEYPAPLHDLRQALNWIVENAARYQIDPQRIGGFGYSSGAHLVSLLAILESGQDPQWRSDARGARLRAVAVGGTPTDLRLWPNSKLVRQFLGVSINDDPDRWTEASPIAHVGPNNPPFFLYHGGIDLIVEADQSKAMQRALDEQGVPAELFIAPYHGHVSMFLLNRSALRQAAGFLQRTLSPG